MIKSLDLYGFSAKNVENILEISARDQFIKNNITKEKKVKDFFQTSLFENDFCDLVVDDEEISCDSDKFELILSNLALQHINSVPEFLLNIKRMLKKDGIFAVSFFGEQNLFDLKKAVFEAEKDVYGGISPRIIPTIDIKNAANLLQKAGFRDPVSSLEVIEVEYESAAKLLQDLKLMAQGNIMLKRSKKMANRKFLDEILKNYVKIAGLKEYEGDKRVLARFEVVIAVGRK